jgi:predicted transcriptional regulator
MAKLDTTQLNAATTIAVNFVSNNKVAAAELPSLLKAVHQTLVGLGEAPAEEPTKQKPSAAAIRKSITPEYVISFEDGRHYKSMRRHLTTRGLTPADYRAKWGLPADYSMVAKSYSAQRSAMAKKIGLGNRSTTPVAAPATKQPPKRGRSPEA